MRYTEYHCGKAVIKDRGQLPAAMQKLAGYEDAEESGALTFLTSVRNVLLDALSHLNDYEHGNEHYLNAIRTVEEIVQNMPAAMEETDGRNQ